MTLFEPGHGGQGVNDIPHGAEPYYEDAAASWHLSYSAQPMWRRPCRQRTVCADGGADPPVRGRRPRRPARAMQDVDHVVPVAGRGHPGPEGTPTGGAAPPAEQDLYLGQGFCGIRHSCLPCRDSFWHLLAVVTRCRRQASA